MIGGTYHIQDLCFWAMFLGTSPQNMARNMVLTYLHFRIRKFHLINWLEELAIVEWNSNIEKLENLERCKHHLQHPGNAFVRVSVWGSAIVVFHSNGSGKTTIIDIPFQIEAFPLEAFIPFQRFYSKLFHSVPMVCGRNTSFTPVKIATSGCISHVQAHPVCGRNLQKSPAGFR